MALLYALHDLSQREGFFLAAAHVDHGMRETSGRDADFVARLCIELQIPCKICRVNVIGKSEDAARRARYEALREACRENGAPVLALAHHRRDQAETLLLHLFRGSGSGGLAAMRECAQGEGMLLWRPLLNVSPETMRSALTAKGIPWMEDETNGQDDYLRNYLRHKILPPVAARFPQAEEAMARAARIFADEDDYLRSEAMCFLQFPGNACLTGPYCWVRFDALYRLHPALKRYVLRLACPVKLDAATTEALMALTPGSKMNLPENGRAECSQGYLHFLPAKEKEEPPIPGKLQVFPYTSQTGDGRRVQAIRKDVYTQCELRFLRPGDQIQPLGSSGTKSMQDYFVDKKVPRPFRKYTPLLCIGNRVVWAVGVGVGEEARVNPGDDAVLLQYDGLIPGT